MFNVLLLEYNVIWFIVGLIALGIGLFIMLGSGIGSSGIGVVIGVIVAIFGIYSMLGLGPIENAGRPVTVNQLNPKIL